MASNERKLVLEIQWKDGKIVTREIEKTADSMKRLEKETDNVDKALSKVKIGAAAAGAALVVVAKRAMDEFIKGQDAVLMMEGALQALGKYTPTASKRMQDLATAIQKVSRYGDDDLLPFMTELLTIGGLNENQLGRTMKAAMDFAVVTGSLGTATMLLAKAAAGNTDTLKRYGIVIADNIPQAQKFEAVLQFIEGRFGGLEQKMAGGLGGAFKQTTNAIGDMLEEGFRPWEASLQAILKLTRDIAEAQTKRTAERAAALSDTPKRGKIGRGDSFDAMTNWYYRGLPNGYSPVYGPRLPNGHFYSTPNDVSGAVPGIAPETVPGAPVLNFTGPMRSGFVGMNQFNAMQNRRMNDVVSGYKTGYKDFKKSSPGLMDIPYEMEGMTEPLENLGNVAEQLQDKYMTLGTTMSTMFANIASGSMSAGQAMRKALLGALADMAMKKGEFWVLEGAAQLAAMNPGGAIMIAKGLAMMSLAGGMAGMSAGRGGSSAGGGAGYNSSKTVSDFGGYGNYNSGPRIVVITADGRNIASGTNVDTVLSRAGIDRQLRNRILEQSRTGALALKAS